MKLEAFSLVVPRLLRNMYSCTPILFVAVLVVIVFWASLSSFVAFRATVKLDTFTLVVPRLLCNMYTYAERSLLQYCLL